MSLDLWVDSIYRAYFVTKGENPALVGGFVRFTAPWAEEICAAKAILCIDDGRKFVGRAKHVQRQGKHGKLGRIEIVWPGFLSGTPITVDDAGMGIDVHPRGYGTYQDKDTAGTLFLDHRFQNQLKFSNIRATCLELNPAN